MVSRIQEIMKKVEEIQNKNFENLVIWSDGSATQFRNKFVFYLYINLRMFLEKTLRQF